MTLMAILDELLQIPAHIFEAASSPAYDHPDALFYKRVNELYEALDDRALYVGLSEDERDSCFQKLLQIHQEKDFFQVHLAFDFLTAIDPSALEKHYPQMIATGFGFKHSWLLPIPCYRDAPEPILQQLIEYIYHFAHQMRSELLMFVSKKSS
jgi:hypothetical protein